MSKKLNHDESSEVVYAGNAPLTTAVSSNFDLLDGQILASSKLVSDSHDFFHNHNNHT